MSRSVMIHSDGTGHGTVVLDEDGNKLANIMELNVSVEANGTSVATIYVQQAKLSVKADVTDVIFVCPACSESIEHHCDSTFAGSPAPDSPHIANCDQHSPSGNRACIRQFMHTKRHFDGEVVWG